jgi:hypothetical protein
LLAAVALASGGSQPAKGTLHSRGPQNVTRAELTGRTRDLEQSLTRVAIFSGVDEATISALAATATRRVWDTGAVLFQRGDAGDYLLALTWDRAKCLANSR